MKRAPLDHIDHPKLRSNLVMSSGQNWLRVHREEQVVYEITCSPEDVSLVLELLSDLQVGGYTLQELINRHSKIGSDIYDILLHLDNLRLITNTCFNKVTGLTSGTQLYRELMRIEIRIRDRFSNSPFYSALISGKASEKQLIGYVLEYYYIVKMAPSLLSPALSMSTDLKEREIFQDFLVSELNHDRFLARSLKSVGIHVKNLELLQPLPRTFALCATLGTYAKQHLSTLKALLYLLEKPQADFNIAFEARCKELQMDPSFYKPLAEHSQINQHADHDNISWQLMETIPVLTDEEQTTIKRHFIAFCETMYSLEEEILNYYGNSENPIPRIFN